MKFSVDHMPNFLLLRISICLAAIYICSADCSAQCLGNLKDAVAKAKQAGRTSISVPTPIPEYAIAESLQDAAQHEAIIVVEIQNKHTSIARDGSCLTTWYRAKVLSNVGSINLPSADASPEPSVPTELSSGFSDQDILIRIPGGSTTIDGVAVSSPERPLALAVGRRYLLFAAFQESMTPTVRSRVAELELGKQGIFNYDSDTDRIEPVNLSSPKTPLVTDVLNRSSGTLRALESSLTVGKHK